MKYYPRPPLLKLPGQDVAAQAVKGHADARRRGGPDPGEVIAMWVPGDGWTLIWLAAGWPELGGYNCAGEWRDPHLRRLSGRWKTVTDSPQPGHWVAGEGWVGDPVLFTDDEESQLRERLESSGYFEPGSVEVETVDDDGVTYSAKTRAEIQSLTFDIEIGADVKVERYEDSDSFARLLDDHRQGLELELGRELDGKLTREQFDGMVDAMVHASGIPRSIGWPDGTTARIFGEARGSGKTGAVRLLRGLARDPFPFTVAPDEPSAPPRPRGLQAVLDST